MRIARPWLVGCLLVAACNRSPAESGEPTPKPRADAPANVTGAEPTPTPIEDGPPVGLARKILVADGAESIAANDDSLCLVRGNRSEIVECLRRGVEGLQTIPTDELMVEELRASANTICMLFGVESVVCEHEGAWIEVAERNSTNRLAIGGSLVCGIQTEGGVACGSLPARLEGCPAGRCGGVDTRSIDTLATAAGQVCGIDHRHIPVCWEHGSDSGGFEPLPHEAAPYWTVAVTRTSVCAITGERSVYCSEQQADGTWQARRMPNLPPVAGLRAMDNHVCASTVDEGPTWCWGRNDKGQLGDGTTIDRDDPVRVRGVPAFTGDIAGAADYGCGLTRGEIWCWGDPPFVGISSD
jgi:hypothetical protein